MKDHTNNHQQTPSQPAPSVEFSQAPARSILDELVQQGARQMLQAAIEQEVETFLREHEGKRDEHGRRLVVRNGY